VFPPKKRMNHQNQPCPQNVNPSTIGRLNKIIDTFGLQEAMASPLLQQWLAVIHVPNPSQAVILETKRALLARFYRYFKIIPSPKFFPNHKQLPLPKSSSH
jgi:hypothetical protein